MHGTELTSESDRESAGGGRVISGGTSRPQWPQRKTEPNSHGQSERLVLIIKSVLFFVGIRRHHATNHNVVGAATPDTDPDDERLFGAKPPWPCRIARPQASHPPRDTRLRSRTPSHTPHRGGTQTWLNGP